MGPEIIIAIISAVASPIGAIAALKFQVKAIQERAKEDRLSQEKAMEKLENRLLAEVDEVKLNKADKLHIDNLMQKIESMEFQLEKRMDQIIQLIRGGSNL